MFQMMGAWTPAQRLDDGTLQGGVSYVSGVAGSPPAAIYSMLADKIVVQIMITDS